MNRREKKGKWIHCPICNHRMFLDVLGRFGIEIKCTSCKRVIRISDSDWKVIKERETTGGI